MNLCHHLTKRKQRCGRSASFRINCKLLCWQHASLYKMFQQKGSQCNFKLLQQFDTIRRPFLGLGVSGKVSGVSGSISVQSMFRVFKIMYDDNTCFIDIGAADGYMLIMALLFGYKHSSGVEYQKPNSGLQDIFNTIWLKAKEGKLGSGFLSHIWSRQKPLLRYDTDIGTMRNSLNSLTPNSNKDIHLFTFWDGFSESDSIALLKKIVGQNVKKGCFISRKSRTFGTFLKLQKQCLHLNLPIIEIKSIVVSYREDKYNAVIVQFS